MARCKAYKTSSFPREELQRYYNARVAERSVVLVKPAIMVWTPQEMSRYLANEMLAGAASRLAYDEDDKFVIKQHVLGVVQGVRYRD